MYKFGHFSYEVLPKNQCQGLKIQAEDQGHNRFEGHILYSNYYNGFYLTTDGITYTDVNHALNVKPVEISPIKKKEYK